MNEKAKRYPLTHPQKRIWYSEKLHPGTGMWNNAGTVKIKGKVDYALLEKAMNISIRDNDAVRIRIGVQGGEPYQYLTEYEPVKIELKDFSELGVEKLYEWDEIQTQAPMPLIDSCLSYYAMMKLSDNEAWLYAKFHHIISDALSIVDFSNQIMANYQQLLETGGEPEDKRLHSYIEYIAEEQEYLGSKRFESDRQYWMSMFEQIPEPTIIKQKKTNYFSTKALRKAYVLPSKLSVRIRNFCAETGVSVSSLFMSAFAIYINRITGKKDIIIGTPVANRTLLHSRGSFGMYVSTVPLRLQISDEMKFADFAKMVTGRWLAALKHQKYPYDLLMQDLRKQHKRLESLYDVTLSYQSGKHEKDTELFKWESRWHFNGYQPDSLAIHVNDREGDGKFIVDYDHHSPFFSDKEIEYFHSHITNIISDIIENPDKPLYMLNIMSDEERDRILGKFNKTERDFPEGETLADLWRKQAAVTPKDAPALICGGHTMTYGELDERSEALALYLKRKGVTKDSIVGLVTERTEDYCVGVLAVIKAGGAFLPIDAELPQERISYMLSDSGARAVLVSPKLESRCSGAEAEVIRMDIGLDKPWDTKIEQECGPHNLAYVIYTSGSTGQPKGVQIEHQSIVHFVYSLSEIWKFNKGAKLLCAASISFDISVMELFLAFLNGATLVLAQEHEVNIPKNMASLIMSSGVNMMVVTPGRMELLLSDKQGAACLKDFREIGLGGDVLSEELLARVQKCTGARIINFYGPTEITVCATYTDVTNTKVPNIGKPMQNVKAYILDPHGNPVPIGIPGELFIGGRGVARGYINKPELNRERFVDNPFIAGQKLYRTGDLTRWYPLGEIEFLGRIDKQVKIRGYRIELGEIENRLMQVSGITGCAVCDRSDSSGRKYLCAYITGAPPKKAEIKAQLVRDLPSYMIPSYFVAMDALPMNSSGKVDRDRLPDPLEGQEQAEDNYAPPETATEQILSQIWGEALGTQQIGRDDSFFDIGGDSLSIVSVMAQVIQAFHVDIRLEDVYRMPRLKDFAAIIDAAEQSSYRPMLKAPEAQDYPVSPAQQRMWVLAQSQPDSIAYNIPLAFSLKGSLDYKRLSQAFKKLAEYHEALRTVFILKEGELRQKVLSDVEFEVVYIRSNGSNIKLLLKDIIKPFDLGKAPLMRASLIEAGESDYILSLDMHHIIGDKHTIEVLLNDLKAFYEGHPPLPKGLEYRDYAVWQQEFLESDTVKMQRDFWASALSGELPLLNLHTDRPRPAVQRFEGARIGFRVSNDTSEKLVSYANKKGVTIFTLLLSAYSLMLSKYTGQEDIIIGAPVSVRSREEIRDTAGVFLNTLPLRCFPRGDMSYSEYMSEVHKASVAALAHADYPLERIISDLAVPRDASRNPLFDAMLIYAKEIYDLSLDGLKSMFYPLEMKIAKLDLTLEVYEENGALECQMEYNTRLFRRSTIKRMISHLSRALDIITAEPEVRLQDISLMTQEEVWTVTRGFNMTDTPLDPEKSIQNIFEETVEEQGDKPAIISGGKSISFSELNRRANRIARKLRELGVTRNSVVAFCIRRSFDMLAAMFGVLKAGGGYLPLDTSYPIERLSFMLSDSGANILLSDGAREIPFSGTTVMLKDVEDEGSCDNLNRIDGMEDIAYVMYTSGSTGLPKGTVIHRRGLLNFYEGVKQSVGYYPELTSITVTTVSFDIFVCDAILPLLYGSTVVLCSEEELRQPLAVAKLIEDNKVRFIQATPTRMRILMEEPAFRKAVASDIEKIMLGGEMVPSSLLKLLKKNFKAQIINAYGPTETTVYSSFKDLTNMSVVTIGKPIDNTRIYVLDRYERPVPIGVPGEGYISGAGVAHGYINRQELNRKVFIPDPFWPGQKMYRTGDVCVFLENGELEMCGRVDHQIKIRGQRVELGEIETAIHSVKGIDDAVVKDWGEGLDKYLCAYYAAEEPVNEESMRTQLLKKLPVYMVPSYFVHMKELPMTLNGKVNRKALTEPDRSALHGADSESKSNMTATEKKMARIWSRILKVQSVGPDDNFFSLGGDSLGAIKLQAEAHQSGWKISTAEFYENPTLRAVCARLDKRSSDRKTEREWMEHIPEYTHLAPAKLKNVLLTGATGYMGVNILQKLAQIPGIHISCLIRKKDLKLGYGRLREALTYYFGAEECMRIMKLVDVCNGDITEKNLGLSPAEHAAIEGTDTVIHCAELRDIAAQREALFITNVKGTMNVLETAKRLNAALLHVSTTGVSGTYYMDDPIRKGEYNESCFYQGQNYADNEYVRSKFLAEEAVIKVIEEGFNARIIRAGTLAAAINEGFRMAPDSNALANRLKALCSFGWVPLGSLGEELDVTPVDSCAKAILTLALSESKHPIFHVLNCNKITLGDLVIMLEQCGHMISVIRDGEFIQKLELLGKTGMPAEVISLAGEMVKNSINITVSGSATKCLLEKADFSWPVIDAEYIGRLLDCTEQKQSKEI